MTVHYHGGPIWGDREYPTDILIKALYRDGGALVSYARTDQLKKIVNIPCKLVLDNGAFSTWKKAKSHSEVVDWNSHWNGYYDLVGAWYSRIEWFIIPDVIEGTEMENDELITRLPSWLRDKAVPVWHSDESIERFVRLCEKIPTSCNWLLWSSCENTFTSMVSTYGRGFYSYKNRKSFDNQNTRFAYA